MRIIKLSIIISVLIALGLVIGYQNPPVSVEQPVSANAESPYPAPTLIPTVIPYPAPVCPTPVCTVNYDENGNKYGTCYQICFEP